MAFASQTTRAPRGLTEDFSAAIYATVQGVTNFRAYRRTVRELSQLNSHALADLGFDRSEIRRVAHEAVYGSRA